MSNDIILNDLEALDHVAKALSPQFEPGNIILLSGPLGSGKTTFVNAICQYYDIKRTSSPTFTLVNQYFGSINVLHIDLYRLHSTKDLESCDIDYYFSQNEALIFVEWPERLGKHRPEKYYALTFDYFEATKRKLKLNAEGYPLPLLKNTQPR